MCGEPLKKGSTACSCGYKESLADRELLRRLARWDRLRTVCSVMLVLGFVAGGVVWWKSGDIRWGLLALFILLAVGIIGLCRCDSRQRKLIWEQMGDFFRSETEQAFGPDTKLPELFIDEAGIRRSQMIDRRWEECRMVPLFSIIMKKLRLLVIGSLIVMIITYVYDGCVNKLQNSP